jgi:hypothetical protein
LNFLTEEVPRAALEAIALETYRKGKLTTSQLRRLLGFKSSYELDGFLKEHEVCLRRIRYDDGSPADLKADLLVTGTFGVLDRSAERGLIELAPAIARLRQTNFRSDRALLDKMLAVDALRLRKPSE